MGAVFDVLDDALRGFIAAQPLFFVGTAPLAGDGHVNISPRGEDTLRVLGPRRLAWLDLTGSGAETIAHLRENGRIVVMWCSFGARPRILRVHGRGTVALPGTAAFEEVAAAVATVHPSTRAAIIVEATRISDSCGFGVPQMDLVGERDLLARAAERRGPDGLAAYRAERNRTSLDGLPALAQPGEQPAGATATVSAPAVHR